MALVVAFVLAFLIGGVPFALVVVRACKGVDVRVVGSGNVGATNASRAFAGKGARAAAFVAIYLLDAGKGFAVAFWGPLALDGSSTGLSSLALGTLLGAMAIAGHVFSPFLQFKGGKGVATATGVLLALDWPVAVIAIGVFFVVRKVSGQVFVGSLALGVALAVAAIGLHLQDGDFAFAERLPVTLLCCALAGFLFWTHRSNLNKHRINSEGQAR